MSLPESPEIPGAVRAIVERLERAGHEAWCVGGALRDAALGHRPSDVDVATSATPAEVRKLFRRTVAVGERFGTVGVLDKAGVLHEVTTFRRDVETDGRHAVVAFGASLEEDLARRDFTINALAYHPERHEWRDPFGGAADLEQGTIRAVGTPVERFREDYLRILRALRFSARFGFAIEPATWEAIRAEAAGLAGISAERVRDEWFKGLRSARAVSALAGLWLESGAAAVWLAGLADGLALEPSISSPPRDPVLLSVLLLPDPAAALRRLRGSNAEIARAERLGAAPAGPSGTDPRSVRRWLAESDEAADDLLRLVELRTGAPASWAAVAVEIRRRGDPIARRDLALRGDDLMALGFQGPGVGRVLDGLLDRVLDDPALNTRDRLLALAREMA
ncbi:MAG TPA: CCA tRNA nucleotidyltransferase [Gemmatimonadales bacterium]|nr:CCA tRNA nucleotidyltransferase [Gemmatimonadales bacterium]